MKTLFKKYRFEVLGSSFGAIAGWCYWYFVGCSTGTCAITSSPVNSTLYGVFLGGLLGNTFRKDKKTIKEK